MNHLRSVAAVRRVGHGPRNLRDNGEGASVLVNAMVRGDFPPIALPPLRPEAPWHGYSLGHWPEHLQRQADLAVRGEYFQTGSRIAQQRCSDVGMNTPIVSDLDD